MKIRISVSSTVLVVAALTVLLGAVPIPPNVPVSGPQPGLQNEEQVWICPKDTSVVLTNHRDFRLGYRQIGLGRGILGGAVWTDTLIHTDYQLLSRQSDPVMTVNLTGDYIICHLDYEPTSTYDDSSYLAFMVSSDCGESWMGPYKVVDTLGPYFEDKQFIACDRTGGPHDGNVYISWTRFSENEPTRIMFARSTTGAASFDDTLIVGSPFYVTCADWTTSPGTFSQPLVGKDGAVYVFWQGVDVDSLAGNCDFYSAIRMNKSTDGGVTWQGERLLGRVDGRSTVDGEVNVYSQPTTDADITDGPHSGNLYLQYRDTVGPPFYESDILFRRSLDTGNTWSDPFRVNDDPIGPDVDQFHNWMVCNNEGVLVSIWYDQRTDPAHSDFDVFAAYSYDGGATWTSNHRVSSVSISPGLLFDQAKSGEDEEIYSPLLPLEARAPQAGLIAEYIGVSCIYDKIVAVWTDTRDGINPGDQDVYSANWYLPLTDPRPISPINGERITDPYRPMLEWATCWKEDQDAYRVQVASDDAFNWVFFDDTVETNVIDDSIACFAHGDYYWRVKAYKKGPSGFVDSTDFSPPQNFAQEVWDVCFPGCLCPHQADYDEDGFLTALDLAALIDVLFAGWPEVKDEPWCPTSRGDFDCDRFPTALDLGELIDHLFAGGAGPCVPCDELEWFGK